MGVQPLKRHAQVTLGVVSVHSEGNPVEKLRDPKFSEVIESNKLSGAGLEGNQRKWVQRRSTGKSLIGEWSPMACMLYFFSHVPIFGISWGK